MGEGLNWERIWIVANMSTNWQVYVYEPCKMKQHKITLFNERGIPFAWSRPLEVSEPPAPARVRSKFVEYEWTPLCCQKRRLQRLCVSLRSALWLSWLNQSRLAKLIHMSPCTYIIPWIKLLTYFSFTSYMEVLKNGTSTENFGNQFFTF